MGLIAFADTIYNGIGPDNQLFPIEVLEGTVLLDTSLNDLKHPGRKRFTQAHEASHWICHRSHHSIDNRVYDFCKREGCPAIACRSDGVEYPGNTHGKWTDEDWEEWQANNLAAALLMPKDMFLQTFYDIMRKYGLCSDILFWNHGSDLTLNIVDDIKHVFNVSRRAVELRMVRLGLLGEKY